MMQQQQRHVTQKPGAGGHYAPGVKQSQYGSIGNVSQGSAGPAPTSKPPTPPQNRVYQSGTLNRSKEYRTPPVVAPPQLPSNYAPNYPRGSRGQQYGTLPHQPQVGMVQPQPHDGGSTMPRLSSASMRSNTSVNSGASSTPPMSHDHYGESHHCLVLQLNIMIQVPTVVSLGSPAPAAETLTSLPPMV